MSCTLPLVTVFALCPPSSCFFVLWDFCCCCNSSLRHPPPVLVVVLFLLLLHLVLFLSYVLLVLRFLLRLSFYLFFSLLERDLGGGGGGGGGLEFKTITFRIDVTTPPHLSPIGQSITFPKAECGCLKCWVKERSYMLKKTNKPQKNPKKPHLVTIE